MLDVLLPVVGWSFAFVVVASAASVVFRFRRSRGDEREQLKWMAFSVVAAVAMVVPAAFLAESSGLAGVGFGLGIALIPVSAGIAMLKYRLYDVDLVISKTLVYGLLTAFLAAAYICLVLCGQWLFSSLAGGSNLAIAGSTLVVATLFLPVRARVQAFVDRRFYRRRYDAERTLGSFGARLREQVDLATLERDVQGVVAETMEPVLVSLWLRGRR